MENRNHWWLIFGIPDTEIVRQEGKSLEYVQNNEKEGNNNRQNVV